MVYEALGAPFVSAVCYCPDCQAGSEKIGQFPGAPSCAQPDGGTPLSTYRRGQWRCVSGENLLHEVKLRPKSPTTRYVSRCCHSAMFLIYSRGFWVSVYQTQYEDTPPPVEWRQKLKYRKSAAALTDALPRYDGFPLRLFWRLIKARFG